MGPVHMYTPKSFYFSNKTKQKEFVTDTPSPNVPGSFMQAISFWPKIFASDLNVNSFFGV